MPPFANIIAFKQRGLLYMQTFALCWSSRLRWHYLMIVSIKCRQVVITSLTIARSISPNMSSMGLFRVNSPGQGEKKSFRKAVTRLGVWYGIESCIRMYTASSGNRLFSFRLSRVSNIRLYWSCPMVPSTIYSRPCTWVTLQTTP